MSNRATIQLTKFEDVRTGEVSYGCLIYDDYAMACQMWDTIPDDNLECLRLAIDKSDDVATGIFDFLQENEKGCYVSDEWYDWEAIQHLWT